VSGTLSTYCYERRNIARAEVSTPVGLPWCQTLAVRIVHGVVGGKSSSVQHAVYAAGMQLAQRH
jgi:hypothetical protein